MNERWWSYTTPNPHRTPISIEVGGDAEVLAEMGGERVERCAICADTPRKTPKGDPCGVCGAMTVEQVWIVKEAADANP